MTRALILGAGVAGLAAAYRLHQLRPDWPITLLEGADRTGGLAAVWKVEGFSADLGPHRIYTELPEIEALLPELIEKEQMLTVPRRSELLLRGHFYRYPVRATELLREMGPVTMTRLGFSAVLGKLTGALRGKADNYEDWMTASFGRGVYQLIIEPYTRKVWKINPRDLSGEVARVRVSAGNVNRLVRQLLGNREGKKGTQSALNSFGYIRGGVEGLVKSLQQKVTDGGGEIQLSRQVEGFASDGKKITGVLTRQGSGTHLHEADVVISTLPVTDLVKMLQPLQPDPDAVEAVNGLVYIGLILVGVVVRRPQFTPNSWIYFPEEKYIFNRSYEPRNFDPSMAPSDRSMVVLEVTARWDSELWAKADEEVIAAVRADLLKTGLVREDEIENAFALRIPHTYPLYTTDYQDRLERAFSYLRRFPNLISTGRQGLFNHNNMDHSMLMGIRAAECAAEEENPAARWLDTLHQFSHFRIVD